IVAGLLLRGHQPAKVNIHPVHPSLSCKEIIAAFIIRSGLDIISGTWPLPSLPLLSVSACCFPVDHFTFANHPALGCVEVYETLWVNLTATFLDICGHLLQCWRDKVLSRLFPRSGCEMRRRRITHILYCWS